MYSISIPRTDHKIKYTRIYVGDPDQHLVEFYQSWKMAMSALGLTLIIVLG
jgi:hypothetical protein